jgi:hypothetical protein
VNLSPFDLVTDNSFFIQGVFQIKYLYAQHTYQWGAEQLSYYISFMGGLCYDFLAYSFPLTCFRLFLFRLLIVDDIYASFLYHPLLSNCCAITICRLLIEHCFLSYINQ